MQQRGAQGISGAAKSSGQSGGQPQSQQLQQLQQQQRAGSSQPDAKFNDWRYYFNYRGRPAYVSEYESRSFPLPADGVPLPPEDIGRGLYFIEAHPATAPRHLPRERLQQEEQLLAPLLQRQQQEHAAQP